MILHGNQRGGATALAKHLLNSVDNDHVTLHELRGFMAADLLGALRESEAISKGTKCKQYMFSLSFNPPEHAGVSIEAFERAIAQAENALSLTDQPRAVVFHEKLGRRHAHVVWSRIDAEKMKAVQLSHSKRKLFKLSKELFLEHGWELPNGYLHLGGASPDNFTMAQWQQAQRLGLDPREIKQAFQTAWVQSDDLKSFAAALSEQGYRIAKGDRRGFVAVDLYGKVYSLPRWLGMKTKEVRARLGSPEGLPSVEGATKELTGKVSSRLLQFLDNTADRHSAELGPQKAAKHVLVTQHRKERRDLDLRQSQRQQWETRIRQERFNRGWRGLWDRLTGRHAQLRRENELELRTCRARDRGELESLIQRQMRERRAQVQTITSLRAKHVRERRRLHLMIADYLGTSARPKHQPNRNPTLDL